jgi:DNA-binding NarL/FixJ family response regulator
MSAAPASIQPLVKVLLVEDEPHTRARFSAAIASEPRYLLMGACVDVASALRMLEIDAPDVLMTDLGLPDGSGLDIIRLCANKYPNCHIMVISMFGDEAHVISSIEAGATGYILKSSEDFEIVPHVDALRAGGSPITPSIARQLLRRFTRPSNTLAEPSPANNGQAATSTANAQQTLSEREVDVLKLVAVGYRYAEIAEKLFISQHTVVSHVKSIYQKLAVNSRSEAVYEALRLRLIDSPR